MTELICNFIDFVIELVMFFYPDVAVAGDFFSNIGAYMEIGLDLLKKINFLVPVPLIIQVLFIMVSLRVSYTILYILNWVIRRIFDVIP